MVEPAPPLRVYVAGASSERTDTIRPLLTRLRDHGVEVTHDWTVCPGYDRPSSSSERAQWALEDLEGVRRADVVWYVAPQNPSEGSHAELGAALALRKRLLVSGPHALRHSRIFTLLGQHHETHDSALLAIVHGLVR